RISLTALRALLALEAPAIATRARVADVVDAGRDLVHAMSWRSFVTHSVSQLCAAYFDDGQAALGPSRDGGLYATWRRQALVDRSPALLMGLAGYRAGAQALPATAHELMSTALAALDVPAHELESYLWSLLLDQNGWASWCAYRRWTARLGGGDDDAIAELLAIRLAWEWLLHRTGGDAVARRWQLAIASWPRIDAAAAGARPDDWLLQAAMEIAWREPVLRGLATGLRGLASGLRTLRPARPAAQAVFCIDVRSEVLRRAIEATSPEIRTLGFAGFFGVPMDYQAIGAPAPRPQLPGLLAPRLRAADTGVSSDAAVQRARHLDLAIDWHAFKTDPRSTFAFVEAMGLAYAGKLAADSLGLGTAAALDDAGLARARDRKPRLVATTDGQPIDVDARCDLAARMLRAMSLTRDLARLVLLAGHGSATRNNPHAAGLDCGACCGQTGEVNARAAAALLNAPEVRAGLAARGIAVPADTWFLAGLHNTTTDELALFELDELPATHREDVATLRAALEVASARARAERASRLGLGGGEASQLERAVRARTTDWAQVRAEWGLAGNAAFIAAPRERCRDLDLHGRAFLHEYRHAEDPGGEILELIMTAPMVVAHWINLQYYASTVDNLRYGSGTKVLHNVVGGHLGVFEGNGGDLRIGLPMQSLHDGARWVHEPLRLSVFLEAPRAAIDAVLEKHATVRALVDNGWLELFQLDADAGEIHARRDGGWVPQAITNG
ncbi:MAG: DUF2309 domain-containing protein, partial [Deltaproteobacteria bacterium]|nr:DUF2309 domain-containing protein [Deltaproteobacteria bacterium]